MKRLTTLFLALSVVALVSCNGSGKSEVKTDSTAVKTDTCLVKTDSCQKVDTTKKVTATEKK